MSTLPMQSTLAMQQLGTSSSSSQPNQLVGALILFQHARAKQLELLEIQRVIENNYFKCQHYARVYGLKALPEWTAFPPVPFPDVAKLGEYSSGPAYAPVKQRLETIQIWKKVHQAELQKIAESQKDMPPPPPRRVMPHLVLPGYKF